MRKDSERPEPLHDQPRGTSLLTTLPASRTDNPTTENKSGIHKLPAELIIEIFKYLEQKGAQWNFARTCNYYYLLAREHCLYRMVRLGHCKGNVSRVDHCTVSEFTQAMKEMREYGLGERVRKVVICLRDMEWSKSLDGNHEHSFFDTDNCAGDFSAVDNEEGGSDNETTRKEKRILAIMIPAIKEIPALFSSTTSVALLGEGWEELYVTAINALGGLPQLKSLNICWTWPETPDGTKLHFLTPPSHLKSLTVYMTCDGYQSHSPDQRGTASTTTSSIIKASMSSLKLIDVYIMGMEDEKEDPLAFDALPEPNYTLKTLLYHGDIDQKISRFGPTLEKLCYTFRGLERLELHLPLDNFPWDLAIQGNLLTHLCQLASCKELWLQFTPEFIGVNVETINSQEGRAAIISERAWLLKMATAIAEAMQCVTKLSWEHEHDQGGSTIIKLEVVRDGNGIRREIRWESKEIAWTGGPEGSESSSITEGKVLYNNNNETLLNAREWEEH